VLQTLIIKRGASGAGELNGKAEGDSTLAYAEGVGELQAIDE
jgi:hypothetical protein